MERYDLYVNEHQAARALDRAAALRAALVTLLQMAPPDCAQTEICIRLAETDELRAVWFWTPAGWQRHQVVGWS